MFLAFNESSPEDRIGWIKSLFEGIGMEVVDQLTYYKNTNHLHSNVGNRDYRLASSYEIINDERDDYTNKDFGNTQEYTSFSSYYARQEMKKLNIVKDIETIKEKLKIGYQYHDQEVLGIITYNSHDEVIGVNEMFKGGVDSSIVDLKLVAKSLLLTPNLKGYSIYHNHPSGNSAASNEDVNVTNRMANMSQALGIELMEHFIISKENVLLFSESIDSFASQNQNYQDKIKNKVGEKHLKYGKDKMNMDIKRGDVIKTSLSEETIVLEVKGEDALLFNGTQFVEAYGLSKNQEKVFWDYGNYYNELPTHIFMQNKKSINEIKRSLSSLIENNYEEYIKAVISIEKDITDDSILTEMYNKYMESDINILNDYFDEIKDDVEHDKGLGNNMKSKYMDDQCKENSKQERSLLSELKTNKRSIKKNITNIIER